jgi:CheY-like chemotaxis protein
MAAPVYELRDDSAGPGGDPGSTGDRRTGAEGGVDPRAAGGKPPCVLLVEDDAAMRIICRLNLESEGFRVVEATDGKEALRLAQSEQPDVVLLDVMLPDLGGFEIASQLENIPVVFLSARASELDLQRGKQAGAIALPGRIREDLDELNRGGSAERVWQMRFGRSRR